MRTTLTMFFVLVVAGCGGGDDDAPSTTQQPAAENDAGGDTGDDEGAAADDVAEDPVEGGSGANTAVVTVGDETYEIEWEAGAITRCDTDFFGGFWALGSGANDGPGLEAQFWPDDAADPTQTTKIKVSAGGDGPSWSADPDQTIGEGVADWPARVDSFEISGNTVTGSATFVGQFDFDEEPVGVPGTFEITCNE